MRVYVCTCAHTYAIRKGHEFEGEKGGADRRAVWEVCRKSWVQSQALQKNQVETCNFSTREAKAEAQKFKVILSSTELEAYVAPRPCLIKNK